MSGLPQGTQTHVILDNYCIHKKNDAWLAIHPNVSFHFTPTSASWLNQVEIWFGILSRKALRGASFHDVEQLRRAIEDFVAAYLTYCQTLPLAETRGQGIPVEEHYR